MQGETYYLVKVKTQIEVGEDKYKNLNEQFLVKATSVTDAEAKVAKDFETYTFDWEVKSVKDTRIIKVIE